MANEATITVALQFAKGLLPSQSLAPGQFNRDVAGGNYIRNVQTVGTSKEVLQLGDVATPGLCLMHNADSTNYVDVFPDGTGAAVIRLKAGDYQLFRFAAAAPQVQANTAPVALEYFLLPD